MRVLVADTFPETRLAELAADGHAYRYRPEATTGELPAEVAGMQALVVRSTRVPAEVVTAGGDLRLVIRAGAGTDTIDTAAAARAGVRVCNVPGRNSAAVAELACALLLALDRDIVGNVTALRTGTWDKAGFSRARGIADRDVGIVGLGRIGLEFAARVAAFGARVHTVAKPGRSAEVAERAEQLGVRYVDDLPALARTCDVLSLHAPGDSGTLLDRHVLAELRPGAIVLNTARAHLVDEAALIEVMDARGILAGIDVFAAEPAGGTGTISSNLAAHPNVYGTHHIGASTRQAQDAVAAEVVRMLRAFGQGEVRHCVNGEQLPAEVTGGAA
ncbi:hydroxyacid dehydrogenase [Saccharopolyspora sp. HNM0983]|uniref:Hydroxyacid dehydrogenase n=1 Tax=Saccharopolyspora montiporae TaxID=2781240 RepID=A0A929B910_9PSEU|nr:NAD(P)-dependent oxidoreductase [Saccharopolyspora sp. HNM0983]MBE9375454.1 hydroxyacid dehydrogenase [Saccharopolyspora sp. HNM0983]